MSRKELTKAFMMISNWNKPAGLHGLHKNMSALQGLGQCVCNDFAGSRYKWPIVLNVPARSAAVQEALKLVKAEVSVVIQIVSLHIVTSILLTVPPSGHHHQELLLADPAVLILVVARKLLQQTVASATQASSSNCQQQQGWSDITFSSCHGFLRYNRLLS